MQELHKIKSSYFGARFDAGAVGQRISNFNQYRKQLRSNIMLNNRNISRSLINATEVDNTTKHDNHNKKVEERMERLQKYKKEKELRKKKEQEKAKPIFKVCHLAAPFAVNNIDDIYNTIKGKPISKCDNTVHKNINKKNKSNETVVNEIKSSPRYMTRSKTSNYNKIATEGNKNEEKKKNTSSKKHTVIAKRQTNFLTCNLRTTRKKLGRNTSHSKVVTQENSTSNNNKEIKQNDSISEKIGCVASNKIDGPVASKQNDSVSEEIQGLTPNKIDGPVVTKQNDFISKVIPVTPDKFDIPVAYVSPFVTTSRGKTNARKEFHSRQSRDGISQCSTKSDMLVTTSPKAGAAYFYVVLNREIDRINSVCEKWENIKEVENPPEDACDMINTGIGQSQLLINKKFQQFRNLIDKCMSNETEGSLVTCEDLHGFWDMVNIQVINIDKRFENLDILKQNSWKEILPVVNKPVARKKSAGKKVAVASRLRDVIKAARQKNKENIIENQDKTTNEEGFSINIGTESARKTRRSLIQRLSGLKKRISSPGLTMVKVSHSAKEFSVTDKEQTPARSILKSNKADSKSTTKKTRVVCFGSNFEIEQNTLPEDVIHFYTPELEGNQIRRRSSRLRRGKLF